MLRVYAPDADVVRKLLPKIDQIDRLPYCAYLFVLARAVDSEAIRFLERYWEAVHDETGDAIAVIVLYDDIRVLGTVQGPGDVVDLDTRRVEAQSDAHLTVVNDKEIVYGSHPVSPSQFTRNGASVIAGEQAIYAASPRWSLTFADEIGLSRSFLPCIVALDNRPGADGDLIVVDLSDADRAWTMLRDAVASFMEQVDARDFVLAIEGLRKLRLAAKTLEHEVSITAPRPPSSVDWAFHGWPSDSTELLKELTQPGPSAKKFAELLQRWGSLDEHRRQAAEILTAVVEDVSVLRALRRSHRCADLLSKNRIGKQLQPGDAPMNVVQPLTDALRIMQKDPAPSSIDELLTVEEAEKRKIVAMVLDRGDSRLSAIDSALFTMRYGRKIVRTEQMDEAYRKAQEGLAAVRCEIAAATRSLQIPTFLPHLEKAVDAHRSLRDATHLPGNKGRWRSKAGKVAGAMGFGADLVQILQGIGVIR